VSKVLLADDQTMIRQGFGYVIGLQADMMLVGEASDGQEAVELTEMRRPHVVLMDIQMPRMTGIEAAHALSRVVATGGVATGGLPGACGAGDRQPITEREQEILQEMAYGLRNDQSARKLITTEGTVKSHVPYFAKVWVRRSHAGCCRRATRRLGEVTADPADGRATITS
jgi:DNA-binding NarL/FixJ family response regulator